MRVALLNPCFWPEVRRGSERFARDLADGLLARGHRPRLITSHPGRPRRDVEGGLAITRHWRPPHRLLDDRGFAAHLTHVPFSYLSLRAGDDDVAHALYPTDALAAVRWSQRTGRPAIVTFMGQAERASLAGRRWAAEIALRAAGGAAAVVALSEAAAASLHRWLGIDARVINLGVDLAAFAPDGPRDDVPMVFCPAAVDEPRKRIPLLLAALPVVRRARPGARLVLVRPRNARLAQELTGVAGVELVDPFTDRALLAAAYRAAWVTALPAVDEAFGLVVVESLACGTPIVGRRDGAIPELVDDARLGSLFDGDDPTGLAGALLQALELAEDTATVAACRARGEDFSIDRCVERYVALYSEVTGA